MALGGGGPFGVGLASPLGASPEALFAAGGSSVAIPEGDPDALRAAEGRWVGMAEVLDRQADKLGGGADTVSLADWWGRASSSFSGSASLTASDLKAAGEVCREVAAACRRLAVVLEDAQEMAKKAAKQAEAAAERGRSATRRLRDAQQRAEAAQVAVQDASRREGSARAAGPLGEPSAQAARADGVMAQGLEADALGEARRSQGEVDSAGEDLRGAVSRGEEANEAAEQAAERAAGVFARAAGDLRAPGPFLSPAVPVTVPTGAGPLITAWMPPLGTPSGRTPGDERRLQISIEQDRLRELAEKREGGAVDRFAGEFKGYTGLHPRVGNPDTEGYKGGEKIGGIAGWFPGPGLVRKLFKEGGEQGLKRVTREGGEEGAEGGAGTSAKRYRDKADARTGALREAASRGDNYVARKVVNDGDEVHHLVPKGEYANREASEHLHRAQAKLQELGIGPDDAANLQPLPRNTHSGIHTNRYFEVLARRLENADSPQQAANILTHLGKQLREGRPL